MILPASRELMDVETLVREVEATPVEVDRDVSAGSPWAPVKERIWELVPGVWLQLLEDPYSRSVATVVFGSDEARTAQWIEMLQEFLEPVQDEELLGAAGTTSIEEDRALAVLRAGFGSPHDFDERFFAVVRCALEDGSTLIRTAGIRATMYSFWPQYRELLHRLTMEDPDPDLRYEAGLIADAPLDQYGISLEKELP